MITTIRALFVLLLSFMFLCLGHGLLNTLVSIRAVLEKFSSFNIGLLGVTYFAGFIFGIYLCSRLLSSVGHIRTFAGLASITSALAVSFLFSVHPLSWMIFRFLYGACIASLYMVIESWLNTVATKEIRGQVLSVYMILIYSCFAISQLFLNVATLDSYMQFLIVSVLISISVVPLCLSPRAGSVEISVETYPVKKLFTQCPFGSLSCLFGGMLVGAIWTLMGAFLQLKSTPPNWIVTFLCMSFVGALIFQYPFGKLSDKLIYRRHAIRLACVLGLLVFFLTYILIRYESSHYILALCFILIGGCSFPIYSLSVALILDYIPPQYIIKSSGTLIIMNGLGSMLGALICSSTMALFGPNAFLIFCGICSLVIVVLSYIIKTTKPIFNEENNFVATPRMTTVLTELDPRVDTTIKTQS